MKILKWMVLPSHPRVPRGKVDCFALRTLLAFPFFAFVLGDTNASGIVNICVDFLPVPWRKMKHVQVPGQHTLSPVAS